MLEWAGELLTGAHFIWSAGMTRAGAMAGRRHSSQYHGFGSMNPVGLICEGWKGPWIEDLWLEHWKQRWAAGADTGDRIYIPVLWINCYFKCDKPRKQEMLQYLTTLKPEYSYMSVYMMVSQNTLNQCTLLLDACACCNTSRACCCSHVEVACFSRTHQACACTRHH